MFLVRFYLPLMFILLYHRADCCPSHLLGRKLQECPVRFDPSPLLLHTQLYLDGQQWWPTCGAPGRMIASLTRLKTFLFLAWRLCEGWHNYHHTFPWDYKTGEFGWRINLTTMFIDLMATLGQVTERKSVPKKTIQARMLRTGIFGAEVGCD